MLIRTDRILVTFLFRKCESRLENTRQRRANRERREKEKEFLSKDWQRNTLFEGTTKHISCPILIGDVCFLAPPTRSNHSKHIYLISSLYNCTIDASYHEETFIHLPVTTFPCYYEVFYTVGARLYKLPPLCRLSTATLSWQLKVALISSRRVGS